MRVRELRVENYRNLRGSVVWSAIGDVEVLHGDNNVGKSNLVAALRLALDLLTDDAWLNSGTTSPIVRSWDEDLLRPPIAPRDDPSAVTVIGVRLKDPEIHATFRLRHDPSEHLSYVEVVDWIVRGAPFVLSGDDDSPPVKTSRRSVARELGRRLGLPERPIVVLDARHTTPSGAPSWDAWLVERTEEDVTGAGRRRFDGVSRALQALAEGRGPGELDWIRRSHRGQSDVELAWRRLDGSKVPFSEQGSGMRSVKDAAVAVVGADAAVVVVEEPEVHLSDGHQLLLRRVLEEAARVAKKQLVFTSHVYVFDGPECARLVRDGGVSVIQRGPVAADPPSGSAEDRSAAVHRAYAGAGAPAAGFVSQGGVMQLPEAVRRALTLPDVVSFARLDDGTLLLVPEAVMKGWLQ